MATLTATEIERIRDIIGDDVPDTRNSGFSLTDVQIQAEWDRADGHDSESKEHLAYYYMLYRLRGKALKDVDTATESGGSSQNQRLRNIERALAEEKALAGIGAFVLGEDSGVMDFGIDENEPEES